MRAVCPLVVSPEHLSAGAHLYQKIRRDRGTELVLHDERLRNPRRYHIPAA